MCLNIFKHILSGSTMLDFRTDTFLTVCKTMNFTAAARELHITQPAVSQHIHFLENEYHTTLFEYHNKQLSLTPAGEVLKRRLTSMKNDEKNIQLEIRSLSNRIESLSIGVTMTIGEYAIVDRLASFLLNHPHMNIHLHYGNTALLLGLLDAGEIDMAIIEGNYPKEHYAHKKYSTEDYIAVCAANHQFVSGTPSTVSDLIKERLIVRKAGSGTRNILEENLLARGLRISNFTHYIEVENMHTIISFLKKDCGISFMYKVAVLEELNQNILKEIQLDDFKMKHDFDFVWGKNSIYTEKYLALCAELLGNC